MRIGEKWYLNLKIQRLVLQLERFSERKELEDYSLFIQAKSEHDGEEISPFLKEIVSSQLDVDRMDYMIRDQANSGAQIGGFDSARVIRALVSEKMDACMLNNGAFLLLKHTWLLDTILYNQVYFHKVNQLTQEYLVRALSRARELANEGKFLLVRLCTTCFAILNFQ